MSEDLRKRVLELENAIRLHRSQLADDRCIEDDDKLYEALGDNIKCDRRVGDKAEMLRNCARFIDQRCEAGYWPSYRMVLADLRASLELLANLNLRYQAGGNFTSIFINRVKERNHIK